jgi:hypothetical protein
MCVCKSVRRGIRQHTSAYVSTRQHTSAADSLRHKMHAPCHLCLCIYINIYTPTTTSTTSTVLLLLHTHTHTHTHQSADELARRIELRDEFARRRSACTALPALVVKHVSCASSKVVRMSASRRVRERRTSAACLLRCHEREELKGLGP